MTAPMAAPALAEEAERYVRKLRWHVLPLERRENMTRPLELWEREEAERLAPEIARLRAEREIAERRLASLKERTAKASDPGDADSLARDAARPAEELATKDVPAVPRLLLDDTTPEKLAGFLSQHGGRGAVMSAEGGLFAMWGLYSRNGEANFDAVLKGHAGDSIRVDRIGRPPLFVPNPVLTVGLAVPPAVIQGLACDASFRGLGLLARFLYAIPLSDIGSRDPDPPTVPLMVKHAYNARMLALARLPWRTDTDGKPEALLLRLSKAGKAAMTDFLISLEPELVDETRLGSIADWGAKLIGALCRIVGLLHLAAYAGATTDGIPHEVPADTLRTAFRLKPYFDHAGSGRKPSPVFAINPCISFRNEE